MLDYVSDFDIFCWRSKNMLYFLENRAWNGAFEKPLLMLRRFFEKPPVLPWTLRDLRKPTSPPLPLREGPPLISVFFNSLYDPFGSPCRGQKRCSNRYAIRLADHQRSTPAAKLRFFVRGLTRLAEEHELKMIQIAGISGDKREFYRPIRFVIRSTPWRGRSS